MDDGSQIVHVKRLKLVLLFSSIVSLTMLILAAFQENLTGDWREYQSEYRSRLIRLAPSDSAREAASRMDVQIQQVFLSDLDRIDRCVSCHVGIDDPRQADQPQPLAAHSGDFLTHHPIDKFGCTVCHDGQGRVIEEAAAHGNVAHWPSPLLRGELTYTSCGRCHYENDLYGAEDDLFAARPGAGARIALDRTELAAFVPGLKDPTQHSIGRGKQLVIQSGCLGCHEYRGRGGTLGPEITHVGDKTVHDFDFSHVKGEHTVEQWLVEHFMNPNEVVPGTLMPAMHLKQRDARDLAQYMMSLQRKTMPAAYTPIPPRRSGVPASGAQIFSMFCASCHGDQGQGSMILDPDLMMLADPPEDLMTPALNNADTLSVASDEFLAHIIAAGRSGTNMISWASDAGGLSEDEIQRLVAYIRDWMDEPRVTATMHASMGDAKYGRALFRSRCASCHGRQGEGGIGVALNSPSFQAIASDRFLASAIVHGRSNTAMPSWSQLAANEVSDLLAHIRSWEPKPPSRDLVLSLLESKQNPSSRDLRIGKSIFRAKCATCHGSNGEGALGPSLNSDTFLSVVGDDYLFDAITKGRSGTSMPAWKDLSPEDLTDLINYIRSFNGRARMELDPYLARGDWDRGQVVFAGACASCHGESAEGRTGPQLNNPEFLASVSDAMLRHWITEGKRDTEMRSFGRDGQGIANLTESQIEDVISYLRRLAIDPPDVTNRPGMGIVALGAEMYAAACAACHGADGAGDTGSALSNPEFLRSASDGYLQATIILGRDGTAMRPMGQGAQGNVDLSAEDVDNIVAFIRSWEFNPPIKGIPHRYVTGTNYVQGRNLYVGFCAGCHGGNGDDGWAPALNNTDFLAAATDGYLQATIARGRADTPMRPFGIGAEGVAELSAEQINDIVGYIRQWETPGEEARVTREVSTAAHFEIHSQDRGDQAVALQPRSAAAILREDELAISEGDM